MTLRRSTQDAVLRRQGYEVLRKDNVLERRGGILRYVSTKYKCVQCQEMSAVASDFQESMWHWVHYDKKSKALVGVVYRKPNSTRANDDKLMKIIEHASNLASELIIFGDFNLPEIQWDVMTRY